MFRFTFVRKVMFTFIKFKFTLHCGWQINVIGNYTLFGNGLQEFLHYNTHLFQIFFIVFYSFNNDVRVYTLCPLRMSRLLYLSTLVVISLLQSVFCSCIIRVSLVRGEKVTLLLVYHLQNKLMCITVRSRKIFNHYNFICRIKSEKKILCI